MNTQFAEHVTNTAFFLSISKKQIKYLAHLRDYPFPMLEYYQHRLSGICGSSSPDNFIASYAALRNKGLVVWVIDNGDKGHNELTNAGKLTCALLVEAGLMVEESADKRIAA